MEHLPRIVTSSKVPGLKGSTVLEVSGPLGLQTVYIKPFVQLYFGQVEDDPVKAERTRRAQLLPEDEAGGPSQATAPLALSSVGVKVADPDLKAQMAMWGTTRALIANAIQGVTQGYRTQLTLIGVGYRASLEADPNKIVTGCDCRLHLRLAYAHPIYESIPNEVKVEIPQSTLIVLKGIDKQLLGEVAARIRRWRPPEPYKGKGIFVNDETIKRKVRKK